MTYIHSVLVPYGVLCCRTSQRHASVSRGRICLDNHTCCHTEIEVDAPSAGTVTSGRLTPGPVKFTTTVSAFMSQHGITQSGKLATSASLFVFFYVTASYVSAWKVSHQYQVCFFFMSQHGMSQSARLASTVPVFCFFLFCFVFFCFFLVTAWYVSVCKVGHYSTSFLWVGFFFFVFFLVTPWYVSVCKVGHFSTSFLSLHGMS